MHDRTAKTLERVGRLFIAASTLHPQKEHANMGHDYPKDYPGKILLSDEERYARLMRASVLCQSEAEALARQAMRILNRTERKAEKSAQSEA